MIKVLFFAQLRELLDTESLEFNQQFDTVASLRKALQARSAVWQESLENGKTLVALNQSIADDNATLKDGDEVAFFPPVTGG